MLIRWTKRALEEFSSIGAFIADNNQAAAERQMRTIGSAVETLSNFPEMGRTGRVPGTRELIVQSTSYIVAYRIRQGQVRILAVLHAAQRWPSRFS